MSNIHHVLFSYVIRSIQFRSFTHRINERLPVNASSSSPHLDCPAINGIDGTLDGLITFSYLHLLLARSIRGS